MEGYYLEFSGAIRFNDTTNIGIRIYTDSENPETKELFIIDENSGSVIFTTYEE